MPSLQPGAHVIGVSIILLFTNSICAYSQFETELEKNLVSDVCDCLNKVSSKSLEDVVYKEADRCLNEYLFKNDLEIKVILRLRGDSITSRTLKQFGKELFLNAIDSLIADCETYRVAISQYKHNAFQQLKVTTRSGRSAIADLRAKEHTIKKP